MIRVEEGRGWRIKVRARVGMRVRVGGRGASGSEGGVRVRAKG